jgi:hypothetical protein
MTASRYFSSWESFLAPDEPNASPAPRRWAIIGQQLEDILVCARACERKWDVEDRIDRWLERGQ